MGGRSHLQPKQSREVRPWLAGPRPLSTFGRSQAAALGLVLLALCCGFAATGSAHAADYAGAISAYRRAHGLPAVTNDSRLVAMALKQAQVMASSGTVSHSAGGSFFTRIAPLRRQRAGENIGAGYLSFADMLKQWEESTGHRQNLLMMGARHVGVASVANPASPYRKFWAMVITD